MCINEVFLLNRKCICINNNEYECMYIMTFIKKKNHKALICMVESSRKESIDYCVLNVCFW